MQICWKKIAEMWQFRRFSSSRIAVSSIILCCDSLNSLTVDLCEIEYMDHQQAQLAD